MPTSLHHVFGERSIGRRDKRLLMMDMELADVKIEPSSWEPTDHVDTDIQVDEMDLKPFYADDLKVEQNEENQTEQATAGSSETSRGTSGSLECLPGTSTDTSRAPAELPREISDDPAVEEHAAVQDNGKKTNLIAQSLEGFAIIANHYSLFEDYKTMARSGKSVSCCQPAACPALQKGMGYSASFSWGDSNLGTTALMRY
ncbi:hypothetical protein FOCC_FOCC012374 [Frankliniella occidentalis]|nr:hypothetical protein FOCC_FOCC012374 [Frankliniella occidentalis]